MNEALEVLTLGPREWKPLARVPGLWKVEALFWAHYLVRLPSLDIWLQTRELDRPPEDFRFGETPYFTGLQILEEAGVGPGDVFFDLGCGRGKMAFLAHLATGCRVVGVELLASYVLVARRMVRALGLRDSVEFRHDDLLRTGLEGATVLYVTAPNWSEATREALLGRVEALPPGTRWISVGWECRHPHLELVGARRLLFSWGREKVWFYRRAGGAGTLNPQPPTPDS